MNDIQILWALLGAFVLINFLLVMEERDQRKWREKNLRD